MEIDMFRNVSVIFIVFFIIFLGFSNHAFAEGMTVGRMILCTGIEDREPIGSVEDFNIEVVERVYLFTEILGAGENTEIKHVWYFSGKKMLEISMLVNGPRWRTWSYKNIYADMTGEWRAEVEDDNGNVLASLPFEIK
jgi:hypothetical protein